jgi:hypothetical protein
MGLFNAEPGKLIAQVRDQDGNVIAQVFEHDPNPLHQERPSWLPWYVWLTWGSLVVTALVVAVL